MVKAFIFDMDGVIIASEAEWHKHLDTIWSDLIGDQAAAVFRFPVGMTPTSIYSEAVKHGSTVSKDEFFNKFDEIAAKVYQESPVTEGIDDLGQFLLNKEYTLGLVSSSPRPWIDTVIKRLSFGDKISAIVSLNDRPDLKPKPHPGGYFETINQLGAKSETTMILEDSNSGIQAAKGVGAFTIGLTTHLLPTYTQHGADIYANNVEDIKRIVVNFDSLLEKNAERNL